MAELTVTTTLGDLLAVPELGLTCRCGAEELTRPVRWAHPTELLDPSGYLRGGELVCTVGSSLVDDGSIERFVAAVASSGAAAICFGVGDVHEDVPPALVGGCESTGLPLLVAPLGVPFIAIGEFIAQRRVEAESAAGARGDALVADLLAGVRAHVAPRELVERAASGLGGRLELLHDGRVLHSGGATTDTDGTVREIDGSDGSALRWTGPEPGPARVLLDTLCHVLDVALHERDVERDLQRERVGQLLALVGERMAAPAALSEALDTAGLAGTDLVFSLWPSGAAQLLAGSLPDAGVVLGETPTAAVLVTADPEHVRALATTVGLACGYSRPVGLLDSPRALGEARAAFELAQRQGGCVGPDELTSLEGLLEQQPPERLRPFVDQLLAPLLDSDLRRGTSYVVTLRSYLDNDSSLAATARSDFLHVNTVRHRLERIRDMTGRDPLVFTDRTALAIALWAYDHLDVARTGSTGRRR
jgi:purine catabolism regulator